jgi:hypothetical protein
VNLSGGQFVERSAPTQSAPRHISFEISREIRVDALGSMHERSRRGLDGMLLPETLRWRMGNLSWEKAWTKCFRMQTGLKLGSRRLIGRAGIFAHCVRRSSVSFSMRASSAAVRRDGGQLTSSWRPTWRSTTKSSSPLRRRSSSTISCAGLHSYIDVTKSSLDETRPTLSSSLSSSP